MQQSCRPQNDGRTKKAGRPHEKGAQTGDNAIGRAQVGRTLASAIEDQELMFYEHRFGNHATGASRHCQSEHGDNQMNDKDQAVAHSGNSINIARSINSDNLGIRHGQLRRLGDLGSSSVKLLHERIALCAGSS
jgi:hypothetical protein